MNELQRVDVLIRYSCALAERDVLLQRVARDAQLFRSIAQFFRETGGVGVARDLEGYAAEAERVIAWANENGEPVSELMKGT